MKDGYIKLSRKFFFNDLWNESRTFNRCEAWLDLIQLTRYEDEPQKDCVGGKEVIYGRGQYPTSIRILSKRWQWSEKKVRCFLEYLKKQQMISTECLQGVNIITLCKYDEYNPRGTAKGTSRGTAKGTSRGTAKGTDNGFGISNLDISRGTAKGTSRGTAKGTSRGTAKGTDTNKEKEINKEKENIQSTNVACTSENDFSDTAVEIERDVDEKSDIDFDMLRDFFNKTMTGKAIPKVRTIIGQRKTFVIARMKEYGKEAVMQAIMKAAESNFLNGGGRNGFIADFSWIFRPNNFPKVLEGNYDNRKITENTNVHNGTNRQTNSTAEQRAAETASIIARLAAEDDDAGK